MERVRKPEVITGLGQFKAGLGRYVSQWHDTREAAEQEYYELAQRASHCALGASNRS